MNSILWLLVGLLAGAVFTAWRLKGNRTWTETARVVIQGGGGPGPFQPK